MGMPNKLNVGAHGWSPHPYPKSTVYIRADLVAKLKGYAGHDPMKCPKYSDPTGGYAECTCGLTALLKRMEE